MIFEERDIDVEFEKGFGGECADEQGIGGEGGNVEWSAEAADGIHVYNIIKKKLLDIHQVRHVGAESSWLYSFKIIWRRRRTSSNDGSSE